MFIDSDVRMTDWVDREGVESEVANQLQIYRDAVEEAIKFGFRHGYVCGNPVESCFQDPEEKTSEWYAAAKEDGTINDFLALAKLEKLGGGE